MLKFNEYSDDENQIPEHVYIDKLQVVNSQIDIDHLICSICHHVLWEPILCSSKNGCHNSFCHQCIKEWIQNCLKKRQNILCPNCKQKFIQSNPPPILKSLLKNLLIKCQFFENGCQKVIKYECFGDHVLKECQYRNKKCQGCKQTVIFKDYESHTQICPKFIITCKQCHTQMTKHYYLKEHHINSMKQQQLPPRSIECYSNSIDNYSLSLNNLSDKLNNFQNHLESLEELIANIMNGEPLSLIINFHTRFTENFLFPEPTLIKPSYNQVKQKFDFLHFYINTPIYLNSISNISWSIKIKKMNGNILLGFCSSMSLQSLDFIVNRYGQVKKKNYQQNKYKLIRKQSFSFNPGDILKFKYISIDRSIQIFNQSTNNRMYLDKSIINNFTKRKRLEIQEPCNKIYAFFSMDTVHDSFHFLL